MKFLQKLRAQLERDRAAAMVSRSHLEDVAKEEPYDEARFREAIQQQRHVEDLARRLEVVNLRNGFSESLSSSFRERPAS